MLQKETRLEEKLGNLQFLTGDTVSFYGYIYNEHISRQENLLGSSWLIDLLVTEIVTDI